MGGLQFQQPGGGGAPPPQRLGFSGAPPPRPGGAQPGYAGGQQGNPMQPVYAPAPPYGAPTLSGVNLGPQATLQKILQGFMPMQRQAQSLLNNQLASAGIVGGGAQGAGNLLQGQLAASIAPTLANAIQNSQGMQLTQAQGNQQAANQMTGQNLQDWMTTNLFNAQNANQSRDTLAQMLQNSWLAQASGLGGILSQGLGSAGNLASIGAQNFPVYQNTGLLGLLGL